MTCLFCGIVASRVPAEIVYQDAEILAFRDINPQAPQHVLVVPKRHIESVLALQPDDDALIGALVRRAAEIARTLGLEARGFRCVFNCGDDAGYSVYHIHLHLLGGRAMAWPPG